MKDFWILPTGWNYMILGIVTPKAITFLIVLTPISLRVVDCFLFTVKYEINFQMKCRWSLCVKVWNVFRCISSKGRYKYKFVWCFSYLDLFNKSFNLKLPIEAFIKIRRKCNWIIISWRMKDQLDVTCYFISLLMSSTCFGH